METGSGGGSPGPRGSDPAPSQRRFTHREFLNEDEERDGPERPAFAGSIDSCNDPKALPPLAKQYRETIREIEEIEGANNHGDEVSDILGERAADGKPGAVRKDRA